jgi:hypothetical protein
VAARGTRARRAARGRGGVPWRDRRPRDLSAPRGAPRPEHGRRACVRDRRRARGDPLRGREPPQRPPPRLRLPRRRLLHRRLRARAASRRPTAPPLGGVGGTRRAGAGGGAHRRRRLRPRPDARTRARPRPQLRGGRGRAARALARAALARGDAAGRGAGRRREAAAPDGRGRGPGPPERARAPRFRAALPRARRGSRPQARARIDAEGLRAARRRLHAAALERLRLAGRPAAPARDGRPARRRLARHSRVGVRPSRRSVRAWRGRSTTASRSTCSRSRRG